MSDPREEPAWEFTPSELVKDIITLSGSGQQQQQEADILGLSASGDLPHSFNSSDLSLADYFPDIFFQTLPPNVTTSSAVLRVREPPTPGKVNIFFMECGQSSRGKRKVDDIETPQPLLATSQSEDTIEERAREMEREQLEETGRQRRMQSTEVRYINERRRRCRINEKIQALGNLIPACKKTEIASILDEAVVYIRALKLQVEMMSMRTGPLQQQQFFPYFPPYLPLPMTPWLGHHPMFALPSSAFNIPPDAATYRPISGSSSFPLSPPQITPLISSSAAAAARSINIPASFSEHIFSVNQPRFSESSSQNIQRLPTSSHSFPIIRQGSFPFSSSYTVHETHIIPPSSTEFLQFDEETDCSKSNL